jgi:hypothetical protein
VRDGLWLDSFEEGHAGELRGWAVGGGGFCGVRIKPDGKVSVGPPQQYLDRALLSGAFGLVVTRAGAALETTDGGFEWSDAEFPSEPEWKSQRTMGAAHGCTRLGCAFSGWLRVGWGMGPPGRLSIAAPPEATRIRQPAGNRWSLDCEATGDASRAALALPDEAGEREPARPSPLAELAAPVRPASERTFDAGSEPELRAFRARSTRTRSTGAFGPLRCRLRRGRARRAPVTLSVSRRTARPPRCAWCSIRSRTRASSW